MPSGFGSELLRRLVQGLSGDITQDMTPTGLHVTLAFDAARLLGPSLPPTP
jgi:two-component sensor histidine kinase